MAHSETAASFHTNCFSRTSIYSSLFTGNTVIPPSLLFHSTRGSLPPSSSQQPNGPSQLLEYPYFLRLFFFFNFTLSCSCLQRNYTSLPYSYLYLFSVFFSRRFCFNADIWSMHSLPFWKSLYSSPNLTS